MLLDLAKPLALLLSMLSLYRVFHAAFLTTATTTAERGQDALARLALAAGVAVVGGLVFGAATERPPFLHTLPVRLFCWAAAGILVLFVASWYIETYVILYRDVRY